MLTYGWTDGARFPAEAQSIGERIERIRKKHGGTVKAEDVVADAAAKSSPLHCCFEWNDRRAADEYRLEQARRVIRSLVVVIDERKPEPTRAFVAIRATDDDAEPSDRTYVGIMDALADPLMREQVLATALRDLQSWRRKYGRLNELAKLFAAVDEQLEMTEVGV